MRKNPLVEVLWKFDCQAFRLFETRPGCQAFGLSSYYWFSVFLLCFTTIVSLILSYFLPRNTLVTSTAMNSGLKIVIISFKRNASCTLRQTFSPPPLPPPPCRKTLHNGSVVNWGIRYNRSYQSCRLLKWDLELVV